jgi:hypothetical protein
MASQLPLRLLSLAGGELQIVYPQTLGVKEFDIITYTWGPTVAPYRCDIPGVDWNVKINPRKLRDIKRLMQIANIQYLWVDCVCLNQEDDKEMAAEVMKMYEYVSLLFAIEAFVAISAERSKARANLTLFHSIKAPASVIS